MAEKAPRPVIPEVLMTPELDLPGEVATIRDVKAERDQHVQDVENARQAMLNMAPSSTTADFDAALNTYNEKKATNDAFTDMWNDYGGEAVDAAQAEVSTTSSNPTSSAYIRAARKLESAEDAFYARMQTEREAIYDDAYDEKDVMDDMIAKRVSDPAKAEKKAYKTEKRRQKAAAADALRVDDKDAAEAMAYAEHDAFLDRTRTHDVDTAFDEAREQDADLTRVKDIDLAEDLAHIAHDIRLTATRTLDVNTAHDEALEENANLTRVHDIDAAETAAHAEHDAYLDTTRIHDADEAHMEALADETRVHDVEEAHERANRMNRRGLRGWLSRMNEKYGRNGVERDKRNRNRVAIVLGTAAVVATAIIAWNAGGDEVIKGLFDNKPDTESVPNLNPLDNSDGGSQLAGGMPDSLPASEGYQYPWNWAEQAFGAENATTQLHELADKAVASGDHTVEWFNVGTPTEWVKVDGDSNTKDVIDILRQYR